MKTFISNITIVVALATSSLFAAPPLPSTFVPAKDNTPKMVLLHMMQNNMSKGVAEVITIWNKDYPNPKVQIAQLLKKFKTLSNSPTMPKQLLKNETYELKNEMNTVEMLLVLDRLHRELNKTYHALFEYSSVIFDTKEGDATVLHSRLVKEMQNMVRDYNAVVKITNREYGSKVLPYYKLNQL